MDLYGVDHQKIDSSIFLNELISKAVSESGLKSFGTLYHKFQPMGFTSVTLLETSHISIHTWPEYKYASIDIFAYDKWEKALKAADIIIKNLEPIKLKKTIKYRDYIHDSKAMSEV